MTCPKCGGCNIALDATKMLRDLHSSDTAEEGRPLICQDCGYQWDNDEKTP
jgi:hypothetical protein